MSEEELQRSEQLQIARVFAATVAQGIHTLLEEQLVAVYLHGSVASGDFVPNKSDLDMIAICRTPLSTSEKEKVYTWLATHAPPQDVRGVDWTVLTQQAVAVLTQQHHWDMALRIQRGNNRFEVITVDSCEGYSILDLAMAREHGHILVGPEPTSIIVELPRRWLLEACVTELRRWLSWEVINDTSSAILTACRCWLYPDTARLGTKSEAGKWVRSRSPADASLMDVALAQRQGETNSSLSNIEVKAFCLRVLQRLEYALRDTH